MKLRAKSQCKNNKKKKLHLQPDSKFFFDQNSEGHKSNNLVSSNGFLDGYISPQRNYIVEDSDIPDNNFSGMLTMNTERSNVFRQTMQYLPNKLQINKSFGPSRNNQN